MNGLAPQTGPCLMSRDLPFSFIIGAPARHTVNNPAMRDADFNASGHQHGQYTCQKGLKKRQFAENPAFWYFFDAPRPAISPQRSGFSLR